MGKLDRNNNQMQVLEDQAITVNEKKHQRPPTADRRPQASDDRPPTADHGQLTTDDGLLMNDH